MKHLTSEDIQNYLDGQLSNTKKYDIFNHIGQCFFCRNEIENYQDLYFALAEEPSENLSPDFDRKVMIHIEKYTPKTSMFSNSTILCAALSILAGILISTYYTGLQPYVKVLSYSHSIIFKMIQPLYQLLDIIFSNVISEFSAVGLIIIFILSLVDHFIIQKKDLRLSVKS
jgi:hypothetical protein